MKIHIAHSRFGYSDSAPPNRLSRCNQCLANCLGSILPDLQTKSTETKDQGTTMIFKLSPKAASSRDFHRLRKAGKRGEQASCYGTMPGVGKNAENPSPLP